MSSCTQCGAPVEPPLTVCGNCAPSTAIQETAPSPAVPETAPSPPVPEVPPEPPRPRAEVIRERAIAGAIAGALWGALYGVAFAFMNWSVVLFFGNVTEEAWVNDFLPALLKCMVIGSLVTAALGAVLKQFPKKKPPKK
jgi:hypothetical protein